jgi:hypothetical protein
VALTERREIDREDIDRYVERERERERDKRESLVPLTTSWIYLLLSSIIAYIREISY